MRSACGRHIERAHTSRTPRLGWVTSSWWREATRVSSLSPAFARPVTEVEVAVGELLQTEMPGERGREEQPRIGHQAVVVEGDVYPVGVAHW